MYENYEEFEKAKVKCQSCNVWLDYKIVVPSDGCKLNPKVMVIGECPGKDEIIAKKPFVGKAGKLLRATLEEFGFNFETNALISNVIPCRPENNKFPKDKSIVGDCYTKWLEQEISITQVEFLLLFGAQPLKYLLGKTGITKLRGQWYELPSNDKVKCLPTFHPSYVQRKAYMADGDEIKEAFRNDIKYMAVTAGIMK